jgi:subtilase family serine protease
VKHVTRLRAVAAVSAASLLAVGLGIVAATAAAAKPTPARGAIAGTHPAWATTRALAGKAATTAGTLTASVYLAPQPGLAAFAQAVSSPGSGQYGRYLTTAQVAARFAPTGGEISAVEQWLTGDGLSVTGVVPGIGGYVQVRGSVVAAAKAFGVTFGTYKMNGTTYRAPEQTASAPAGVSPYVLSVVGLDTARHDMRPAETLPPPPQNYFTAPDCSTYYGQDDATRVPGTRTAIPRAYGRAQPWTNCGYTPAQIRGVYGVTESGETGKGVTVAVVDAYASPTMLADANQYAVATGDKPFARGQYKQVLLGGTDGWDQTASCDASGWYGEESLDVESVHGMAPGASVTYVGAVDCTDQGLLGALTYIVKHHTADIVSDSWGEPYDQSQTQGAYDAVFEAGAAEGIGFFFSAGDDGYEDPNYEDPGYSDKVQVDYPTSSPWVTSVGGTSLAIGPGDSYEFETPWGTTLDPLLTSKAGSHWAFTPPGSSAEEEYGYVLPDGTAEGGYDGSGGGGVSTAYQQPWYQAGVVPRSLATTEVATTTPAVNTSSPYTESLTTVSTPMRVVPDVSALADPSTGILVGETLYGPGKLSSKEKFYLSRIGGTSVASPVFAGVEADAEQAAGHPIGFANPVIYDLAQSYRSVRSGPPTADRQGLVFGAFHDVTSHPWAPGPGNSYTQLAEVRDNYSDPSNETLPLLTWLRTLGVDGVGDSALTASPGYDDATGVGTPDSYVEAFQFHRRWGW